MRKGQTVGLILDRLRHIRITVAQTGHRRPARTVQVGLAIGIVDIGTFAAHSDRHPGLGMAWKNVAHGNASRLRCLATLSPSRNPSQARPERYVVHLFAMMEVAGAAGLEPATYGFGDRRSTS